MQIVRWYSDGPAGMPGATWGEIGFDAFGRRKRAPRVPICARRAPHNTVQAHRDVDVGHGRANVSPMIEVAA